MATKNPFVADLDAISKRMDQLAAENTRIVEWTFNSSAWKVLQEIRRPESEGGWPIDTRESWKRWGFRRIKTAQNKVVFSIFNDAPALRGRLKGHAYAGWVYAKDGTPPRIGIPGSPLIARPIVKRAIMATVPTIKQNFNQRVTKFLSRRKK